MSLMAVGYKIKKIFSLIESGELLDLESVIKKAKELVKCTPKVGQKKFNFRRCIFLCLNTQMSSR